MVVKRAVLIPRMAVLRLDLRILKIVSKVIEEVGIPMKLKCLSCGLTINSRILGYRDKYKLESFISPFI
jgi:hypothetical protein